VDARSDIFSMGVSLYRTLSGRLPWSDSQNVAAIVLETLTTGPIPLASVAPWVDPALVAVVERAMALEPEQRWPSARAMAEALAPLAAPGPLRRETLKAVPAHLLQATPAGSPSRGAFRGRDTRPDIRKPTPGRARAGAWAVGAALSMAALVGGVSRLGTPGSTALPAGSASAAPRCVSGALCSAQAGQPAVCGADGRCLPVTSEDCAPLASLEALSAETLWFGLMFPRKGPDAAAYGEAMVRAADLARQDFARISGGLPGANGEARALGLVACDDSASPERAARHLIEGLGVPAVIGFHSSNELVELGTKLLVPAGTLGM
jgi:hypothetical protein